MKKYLRNERGLTLVEMLATLVILAIIATIAAVAIGNIIQNSKDKAVLADALSIVEGAKIAFMDDGTDKKEFSGDELKGYVEISELKDISVSRKIEGDTVSYTVKYPKLKTLKGQKYREGINTNEGVAEERILQRNLKGSKK